MLLQVYRHTALRLSALVRPDISSTSVLHVSRSLTRAPPRLAIACQVSWHLHSSSRWTSTSTSTSISTSSTDPLPPNEDSSQPTIIRVLNLTGHQDRTIKRSFPNGKPENLVQGLERLTAQAIIADKETGNRKNRQGAWHLRASGDAILRFLAIQNPECVNSLKYEIGLISKELGHHPHYMLRYQRNQEACIFVIMCTTHVPHGLSLNDVKLADRIDEAIQKITTTATRTASNKKPITVAPPNSGKLKARLTKALVIEARIYRRNAAAAEIMSKGDQQSTDDTALDDQFKITQEQRAFLAQVKREQKFANRMTVRNIQTLMKTTSVTDNDDQNENSSDKSRPVMINAYPQSTTNSPRPAPKPQPRPNHDQNSKTRIRFVPVSSTMPPRPPSYQSKVKAEPKIELDSNDNNNNNNSN